MWKFSTFEDNVLFEVGGKGKRPTLAVRDPDHRGRPFHSAFPPSMPTCRKLRDWTW